MAWKVGIISANNYRISGSKGSLLCGCYGRNPCSLIIGGNVVGDAPERKHFRFLYSGPHVEFWRWRWQSCLTAQAKSDPGWWLSCSAADPVCRFSLLRTQGALTGHKGSEPLCYHVSLCQQLAAAHTHTCYLNLKPQSKANTACLSNNLAGAGKMQHAANPLHWVQCNANMQCKHLNIFPQKKKVFFFLLKACYKTTRLLNFHLGLNLRGSPLLGKSITRRGYLCREALF